MKKWKRMSICGLALAVMVGTAPAAAFAETQSAAAQDTSKESQAAEAVDSLTPVNTIEITEEAGDDGTILTTGEEPLTRESQSDASGDSDLVGAGNLPSSYSTRTSGRMTNVMDQNLSSLCWAIAGLDNAQIGLLKAGTISQTSALFSAGQLAYAAYHAVGDTWKGIGDYEGDSSAWYAQGGNYTILGSTLARWYGAAPAASYGTPGTRREANAFSIGSSDFYNDISHLDSFEVLPQPNDAGQDRAAALREIKQAVRDYGSVAIDYYANGREAPYSDATHSFYSATYHRPTHQGVIVGWDDSKVTQAPQRGAFLVKNTWGTGWAEGGYHWLAYQDASMDNPVVYHMERTASGTHEYTGNYGYDGVGQHRSYAYAHPVSSANVFTAVRNENVAAVGTYIPAGGHYTVSVLTGMTDGTPNTGHVVASANGMRTHYGYYTIPLDHPVSVGRGSKFAVSVSVWTGSGSDAEYLCFFENGVSASYYDTVANPGESYLSTNGGGSWADVQSTSYAARNNVCIKALTTGNEAFSFPQQESAAANRQAMYRMYNPNSGEHFYTASREERQSLIGAGWSYEGLGWYAPTSGDPVYRLYNPNAGDHHYTSSAGERDALVRLGWNYEGIGWHSGGDTPIYRQYNPNAAAGAHNYTKNVNERNYLVGVGWRDEGIGWYAAS